VIHLDTTILVYAAGEEHPLRAPCRRVLQAHGDGLIHATATVEVIQEFAHVYARRRGRARAAELAAAYADALEPVMTTPEELRSGLDVWVRHPRLGAFDAVVAAVAISRGANALISADHAFEGIPGLRWIDPATTALTGLLGAAPPDADVSPDE
jgi:predicted nucleic acid-binding protein